MSGSSPPNLTINNLFSAAGLGLETNGAVGETRWPTVYCEVTECRTGRPLYFGVMAAEEEKNGVQGVPPHLSYFFLRYFSECKCGTSLEVDVLGEGERRQGIERGSGEEVGCGPI